MNPAEFEGTNASRVTEQMWVGGDLEITDPILALKQLDELDASGLTDIVDLRLEWDDEEWVKRFRPHIRYHWLGVDDGGQRMPGEWFDSRTRLIRAALADGGKALVHCHMGINRGPSMGFAACCPSDGTRSRHWAAYGRPAPSPMSAMPRTLSTGGRGTP